MHEENLDTSSVKLMSLMVPVREVNIKMKA